MSILDLGGSINFVQTWGIVFIWNFFGICAIDGMFYASAYLNEQWRMYAFLGVCSLLNLIVFFICTRYFCRKKPNKKERKEEKKNKKQKNKDDKKKIKNEIKHKKLDEIVEEEEESVMFSPFIMKVGKVLALKLEKAWKRKMERREGKKLRDLLKNLPPQCRTSYVKLMQLRKDTADLESDMTKMPARFF
mmetsp:Transcript_21478/g.19049  ORF Transcript_21478/g.19049 Transcript_21478/m.19049 type:complete len:190 (+) Transcript_21478:1221-1790(+)